MRVFAYRVTDPAACLCRDRCVPGLGHDHPHRTGYWVAYRIDENNRQAGPAVKRWYKRDAVADARVANKSSDVLF